MTLKYANSMFKVGDLVRRKNGKVVYKVRDLYYPAYKYYPHLTMEHLGTGSCTLEPISKLVLVEDQQPTKEKEETIGY